MPSFLSLAVTFLDPRFHGCGDAGAPEWPPSPLRLFQALVAATAAHDGGTLSDESADTLRWLEAQPPPEIIAPRQRDGAPYRLSVPNNAMDKVGAAWSRGNLYGQGDANPATHRAMKTVRPTHLVDGETVYYLWPLSAEPSNAVLSHVERLQTMARRLVALGWGIDLVVGNARILSEEQLPHGVRWFSGSRGSSPLRTPVAGTLHALTRRHDAFLNRLADDRFSPVPGLPVTAFSITAYRREDEPPTRPVAAFQLLKTDASGYRIFEPRKGSEVTGMLRHAAAIAAQDAGWSEDRINRVVLGHGESRRNETHQPVGLQRFAYLPLPSLERRRGKQGNPGIVVSGVRRALLTVFSDDLEREIDWARRALSGRDLLGEPDAQPKALMRGQSEADWNIQQYLKPCATWATVTPVVLPGHDDRNASKTELLLRKALVQAGFSEQLANVAELDWRHVGFWTGIDMASRYFVPKHLQKYRRVHVRLTWKDSQQQSLSVSGPVCIGGGRFYGLGLFAAQAD
jgi:CRISPR-associated protein Csb2